jgi:hypothetical protein
MGFAQVPGVFKGIRNGVANTYSITTRFAVKNVPGLVGDSAVVGSFDDDPEVAGRLAVTFSGRGARWELAGNIYLFI